MIKHILVTYLIMCLALTGCAPSVSPFAEATATPVKPFPSLNPTITPMVSVALTSSPTQGTQINISCPTSLSNILSNISVDDLFLLNSLSSGENSYLLNLAMGEKVYLPYTDGYYLDELRISPNHQWIAYFVVRRDETISNSQLIVSDLNGVIVYQQSVDRTKKWYLIDTWLDNQTLMLERYQTLPDSNTLASPLPVTLLNPFTGESRDLDGDFPNMLFFFEPSARWDVFGKSGTAYDSTLNLVAYASESRDDLRQSVVLWDIKRNLEIARIQAAIGFGSGPVWSPDGSQFIIDSLAKIPDPQNWTEEERLSEELFSVSRTGEITRLTYLTNQFKEVSISDYAWSPDGSQIAFNVLSKPDIDESDLISSSRLAVLDIRTKQLTMYCIRSLPGAARLFWSPNGQQILMGMVNVEKTKASNNTLIYDTVLMDLTKNMITKIADDTVPNGWMIKPP